MESKGIKAEIPIRKINSKNTDWKYIKKKKLKTEGIPNNKTKNFSQHYKSTSFQ